MTRQPKITLTFSLEDKDRLEHIARELGFTSTRGAGTGKIGSISALVRAVARGTLLVVPSQQLSAEEHRGDK